MPEDGIVKSLKQSSIDALRSYNAKTILEARLNSLTIDHLEVAHYFENSHLDAKGRIPQEHNDSDWYDKPALNRITRNAPPVKRKRKHQSIDGAKLESYDMEKDEITIRIDDSENLPFWCEVIIPLKRLKPWLHDHGIEMTFRQIEEESKDDSEEKDEDEEEEDYDRKNPWSKVIRNDNIDGLNAYRDGLAGHDNDI